MVARADLPAAACLCSAALLALAAPAAAREAAPAVACQLGTDSAAVAQVKTQSSSRREGLRLEHANPVLPSPSVRCSGEPEKTSLAS